jgi:hypothetical protein
MAVPHELERRAAAEPLIARLEVDVREVRRGAPDIPVVVAAVDVHPDTAELVDDLLEAVEVDLDQVVDRQSRQVLHRFERARRAAAREG